MRHNLSSFFYLICWCKRQTETRDIISLCDWLHVNMINNNKYFIKKKEKNWNVIKVFLVINIRLPVLGSATKNTIALACDFHNVNKALKYVYIYHFAHRFWSAAASIFLAYFYVLCEQHRRYSFNPFLSSEKNLPCKPGLRVYPHRVVPLPLEYIVTLENGSGTDFQASPHYNRPALALDADARCVYSLRLFTS